MLIRNQGLSVAGNLTSSRRNYFRLPQQFLAWLRNNVEARASTLDERGGEMRAIKYGAP